MKSNLNTKFLLNYGESTYRKISLKRTEEKRINFEESID